MVGSYGFVFKIAEFGCISLKELKSLAIPAKVSVWQSLLRRFHAAALSPVLVCSFHYLAGSRVYVEEI